MALARIGEAITRNEDQRFVTGPGTYVDDINLDGQAWAAVLRSTEAHARIGAVDTSEAASLQGVLLIVTGEDWRSEGFCPVSRAEDLKHSQFRRRRHL